MARQIEFSKAENEYLDLSNRLASDLVALGSRSTATTSKDISTVVGRFIDEAMKKQTGVESSVLLRTWALYQDAMVQDINPRLVYSKDQIRGLAQFVIDAAKKILSEDIKVSEYFAWETARLKALKLVPG